MAANPGEWFKQAEYDIKTARIMFKNERYIYAVFMCHLSIEKALKGLYHQSLEKTPPKTHNLIFLAEKIRLELNEEQHNFLYSLNIASVPTRYPDVLSKLQKNYNKKDTQAILKKGSEVLKCLKEKLKR